MNSTPEQWIEAVGHLLEAFEEEALPKLKASAITMVLCTGKFDSAMALQLGAALLLDKPLMVVAIRAAIVPEKILAAADVFVEISGDMNAPENKSKLMFAITRLLARTKPT